MSQIFRSLPNNQYEAAINANAPSASNPFLTATDLQVSAYASYYTNPSGPNLISPAATPTKMFFNILDFEQGFTLDTGTFNQFEVTDSGIYTLQFSAQVEKGGGTADVLYIWPEINGNPVPNSNSSITLANNGHRTIAAWNWFLNISAGDIVAVMWTSELGSVELINTVPLIGPAIPAVIINIQKVS